MTPKLQKLKLELMKLWVAWEEKGVESSEKSSHERPANWTFHRNSEGHLSLVLGCRLRNVASRGKAFPLLSFSISVSSCCSLSLSSLDDRKDGQCGGTNQRSDEKSPNGYDDNVSAREFRGANDDWNDTRSFGCVTSAIDAITTITCRQLSASTDC